MTETDTSTTIENCVTSFDVHQGLESFLKSLNQTKSKGKSLASCRGGIERSDTYNSEMPNTAHRKVVIDANSPLNGHHAKGIPLAWLPAILMDSQVSDTGVRLNEYEDEINHLVLVVQEGDEPARNMIFRSLQVISKQHGGKLPITVDVIVDVDKKFDLWKSRIVNFSKTH